MAWIRTSCPTCGDVEVGTDEVQVMMCSSTIEGSYAFRCPSCELAVSKRADADVVDVLVTAGVRLSVWQLPAELDEAHHGPPVEYDDLLEFHFHLQRDEWVEELEGGGGRGRHHLEAMGPTDPS